MRREILMRNNYLKLSKAKISPTRGVVISSYLDANGNAKGFTLAQVLEANEEGNVTTAFLKGSLHLDSVESLINLRDALNVALSKVKPEEQSDPHKNSDNVQPQEGWDY